MTESSHNFADSLATSIAGVNTNSGRAALKSANIKEVARSLGFRIFYPILQKQNIEAMGAVEEDDNG